MTFYSTGKSPYLQGRGKPINAEGATAELLLQRGYVVKFLDELSACPQHEQASVEEMQTPHATEEPSTQNLEIVIEKQKRQKRDTLKKKTKPVKNKNKRTKTEKAG